MDKRPNGKLNLSHLPPEEIARAVLATPPPREPDEEEEAELRARRAWPRESLKTGHEEP